MTRLKTGGPRAAGFQFTASGERHYDASARLLYWNAMDYQVPQFIEIEDKVIGPLTIRQFLYLAGAGGLTVIFFVYLPFFFAALLSAPIVALAAALAFYKVNGKPFAEMLEAGVAYYTRSKLFLWRRGEPKSEQVSAAAAAAAAAEQAARAPKSARLTRGKLSDLAWSLDVRSGNPDSSRLES